MQSPCGTRPCWPPTLEPRAAAMLKRRCHIRFPPPHLPSLSNFLLSHPALPSPLSLAVGRSWESVLRHCGPTWRILRRASPLPCQTGLPSCARRPGAHSSPPSEGGSPLRQAARISPSCSLHLTQHHTWHTCPPERSSLNALGDSVNMS